MHCHCGGTTMVLPQQTVRWCVFKDCKVSCLVIGKALSCSCSVGAEAMWGLSCPTSKRNETQDQVDGWILADHCSPWAAAKSCFWLLSWWSSWAVCFVTALSKLVYFLRTLGNKHSMGHTSRGTRVKLTAPSTTSYQLCCSCDKNKNVSSCFQI